jgi:flagellar biogenesis protein FliO
MKTSEKIEVKMHMENSISMLKTLNMNHAIIALGKVTEKSIEDSYSCEKFLEEILKEEIQGREKRKY